MTGTREATIRRAISLAIRRPGAPDRILLVRRPPDDPDLPGVWGLPAGSLRPGEDWEGAARRAGREKLGIELEIGPMLREGTARRRDCILHMRLFAARIARGEPSVPQPHPEVTQYRAWRWGAVDDLRPAADAGSLCGRLCLEAEGRG